MQFRKVWRVRQDIRRLLYDRGRPVEDLQVLARRLGRFLNKKYKTQFHWNPSEVLDAGHLVFSGNFDSYVKHQPISIWINTRPEDKVYEFNREGCISWQRFVNDLSECIMHEKVHQFQYHRHKNRSRINLKKSDNEELDYYSDPDEIDAYSWSLASELLDHSQGFVLPEPDQPDLSYSIWWNYANIFDVGHPVRKRLLCKTYKRVQLALENDVK